jgi:hypothetical protein
VSAVNPYETPEKLSLIVETPRRSSREGSTVILTLLLIVVGTPIAIAIAMTPRAASVASYIEHVIVAVGDNLCRWQNFTTVDF